MVKHESCPFDKCPEDGVPIPQWFLDYAEDEGCLRKT